MDNQEMQLTTQPRVVIGREPYEHVTIEIVDGAKEGFLESQVTVCCGGWSGTLRWYIFSGELSHFAAQLSELYRNLLGVAELNPLEPNLTLHMSGDGRGHIVVTGMADAHLGCGTNLVFQLGVDQTELPAILKSLQDVGQLGA